MSSPSTSVRKSTWIDVGILVGAGLFMFALIVSAVFDPTIRVLHSLQLLIYVAVIVLTRRNSAWGYGAGFLISVMWNYTNLFVTTFIASGVEQLAVLLRTGHLERPDLLVALVAGGGHFLLILCCLVGFLLTRPTARRWVEFVGGGLLAVGYFVVIIVTTGPQYIGLLHRVFKL